jgi:hypothetical protein
MGQDSICVTVMRGGAGPKSQSGSAAPGPSTQSRCTRPQVNFSPARLGPEFIILIILPKKIRSAAQDMTEQPGDIILYFDEKTWL